MEQIGEIVLKKVKAHGLVISRVPDPTRNEFIEYADGEFAGDYGMLLKTLWDSYKIWMQFIGSFDLKLNNILEIISRTEQKPEDLKDKEDHIIKFLSGRKVNIE